jgi:hypothetical protein
MPQLNVGQTGSLKSIPKLTKINGDDSAKAIYRNLGNNHAYPFMWASEVMISGTELVVASGIKWHGFDLATYANVTITPLADPGANRLWVEKNTSTNVIKIKSSASQNNLKIDVKFMLGEELEIVGLYCRGNTGAAPSLP